MLQGAYNLFIQAGSPESLIKKIAPVNETYFRGVTLSPVLIEANRAILRYSGFAKHHHLLGYAVYRKALAISGAKDPRCDFTIPISQGKSYAEITIRWS